MTYSGDYRFFILYKRYHHPVHRLCPKQFDHVINKCGFSFLSDMNDAIIRIKLGPQQSLPYA